MCSSDLIYGIGLTTAQKLLAIANVNPDTRTRDLTEDEVGVIGCTHEIVFLLYSGRMSGQFFVLPFVGASMESFVRHFL